MDESEYYDLIDDVIGTIEDTFAEEENPSEERVREGVRATLLCYKPEE